MSRVRVFVAVLALGVAGSSCGDDESGTAHLLYISDSSSGAAAPAYQQLAAEALDREVELVDWRVGGLSIGEATEMIVASPDKVADADVVVLWANPTTSGIRPGGEVCMTLTGDDPGPYTAADFAPFAEDVGAAIDLIWEARGDEPTIIRVMDLYMADPALWDDAGITESCRTVWESISAAAAQAAAEHGATFVSRMDLFNGPDRDEDPVAKGYLASDGIHPSQEGGEAIAAALAAVGFEPSSRP